MDAGHVIEYALLNSFNVVRTGGLTASNPENNSLRSMAVLSSRTHERRSREKKRFFKLLPPQSSRGFSSSSVYNLVRPTKTSMLRRLVKQ